MQAGTGTHGLCAQLGTNSTALTSDDGARFERRDPIGSWARMMSPQQGTGGGSRTSPHAPSCDPGVSRHRALPQLFPQDQTDLQYNSTEESGPASTQPETAGTFARV